MTILRQQYLDAIRAALAADANVTALAKVGASVVDALAQKDAAAVVVHRGAELPRRENLGVTDRYCHVLVTIVVRSATPDALADQVLEAVHPVVIALDMPGLIEILEDEELGTGNPVFVTDDVNLCLCTTYYMMRYRTTGDGLI